MIQEEKGFVFLPILLLSTLLFFYLSESIPLFLSYHRLAADEWGKLQAEANAEAGVWMAIEEWSERGSSYTGNRYILSKGEVLVSITYLSGASHYRITSSGSVSPYYKRDMIVTFDLNTGKIITWQR